MHGELYIYIYICIKVISGLIGLIYENIAKIEKSQTRLSYDMTHLLPKSRYI